MTLEYIPAKVGFDTNPVVNESIATIREQAHKLKLDDAVLYYGWPRYTDYNLVRHYIDIAILSPIFGLILIRVLPDDSPVKIKKAVNSISQASATALSQLIRSPILRDKTRQLKVTVTPIILAPSANQGSIDDVGICGSQALLLKYIKNLPPTKLTGLEFQEVRSIIEGAKALMRPARRRIEDPSNRSWRFL